MSRSPTHRSTQARIWSVRGLLALSAACATDNCSRDPAPVRVVECPRFIVFVREQPQTATAPVGGVARFEGALGFADEPTPGVSTSWQRGPTASGPWEAVTAGASTPPGDPFRRVLDVAVTPDLAGWHFRLRVQQLNSDEPAHCRDAERYTTYSTPARLDLSAPPEITAHPQSLSVTVGDPAAFTVVASGNGLTYQWQRDGVDIGAAGTAAIFLIPNAALTDAGEYRVIVTSADQLADTSEVAVLTVLPAGGNVITWTGDAGTTDWFTPGNWDLLRLPAAADSVIIAAAGAEVDVRRPAFEEFDVTIGALRHSAGTLRVVGPSNCPNCSIFRVERAITSTGAGTLLETGHVRFIVGEASALAHLRDLFEGGMVLRPTLEGPVGGSAAVAVGRLEGNPVIDGLDVTVTDTAQFDGGVSVVRGSLLIADGAGAAVVPPRTGAEPHFSGPLTVAGRLYAQGHSGVEFNGPVLVSSTGLIEFGFTRFNQGLTLAGELRGNGGVNPSSVLFFGSAGQDVTIASSGRLEADDVSFTAPTVVAGQLQAARVQASPSGASNVRTFSVTATATLDVDHLALGSAPTLLALPGMVTGIDSLASSSATITLEGPGALAMRHWDSQGTTFRGLAGAPVPVTVDSVRFRGSAVTPTVLDAVALTVAEFGLLENAIQGRLGSRLILPGTNRFVGATIAPATAGVPGSFYVEHLGTFQASAFASTITACISTGPGAQVLAPIGSATLTLAPLPAGECP